MVAQNTGYNIGGSVEMRLVEGKVTQRKVL